MRTLSTDDGGVVQTAPPSSHSDLEKPPPEAEDGTAVAKNGKTAAYLAAESGQSRPENSPSPSGPEPSGPESCTCGFCDGVEIADVENVHTGAVEETFTRMSRRERCPNCGGMNVQYRRSLTAHVASLGRRLGRTRHIYFVSQILDREAADRAGIDGESSYQVLTGAGGVWTKCRSRIRYRDGDFRYFGVLASRPSDKRYHVHALAFTSLDRFELAEAFHVRGADTHLKAPRDDGEGAERFAAKKGAYMFDNAARSPSARFISSNGAGEGFDSERAVAKRRGAAEAAPTEDTSTEAGASEARCPGGGNSPNSGNSTGDADTSNCTAGAEAAHGGKRCSGDGAPTRARSPRRNQHRKEDEAKPKNGAETTEKRAARGERTGESGDRAPPVRMDRGRYKDEKRCMRAVQRSLMGRVGGNVHISGMGRAKLLKVATEDGRIVCTVAPEIGEAAVKVRWTEIAVRNAPRLVRVRQKNQSHNNSLDVMNSDNETTGKSPKERFNEEAETSTVTVKLRDGRRRVTEKNHDTGETREYIKPPKET